jgi:hypothetical protein
MVYYAKAMPSQLYRFQVFAIPLHLPSGARLNQNKPACRGSTSDDYCGGNRHLVANANGICQIYWRRTIPVFSIKTSLKRYGRATIKAYDFAASPGF